jgi:hypothetical protein
MPGKLARNLGMNIQALGGLDPIDSRVFYCAAGA